jgi:alpha-L-fucosidase
MTTRREFFKMAVQTASAALLSGHPGGAVAPKEAGRAIPHRDRPILDLQQRFVDLRFGMFLHFNMATFLDREWGDPTSSLSLFHRTALDTDQWIATTQSANMTWGCLTTRHHDGFCIWPTKTGAASVGQTLHSTDVVLAYANSFRKAGLRIGLYYSILSLRDDIRHFNLTPIKVKLIKDQLTELFTEYGEIDILITDGWNAPWSRISYEEVPFQEISTSRTCSRTACFAISTPASTPLADSITPM